MQKLALPGLLAALALALPAPAVAGDPTMPLGEVRQGMACTSFSVVRGTEITSFDVEVLDVLTDDPETRILVRASGPAVDGTGITQGFSGSPVYCPGADGAQRVIGAISEGTGDFGNKLVLVTPIEAMLGEPPDPPAGARSDPRTLRSARSLAGPLTFGGVSGPVAAALRKAARRAGRQLIAGPAAPRAAAFPQQALVPGAAVAVGYSSGDLSAGAIGTVTYVDGPNVWAFGHPLDAAGRRALLLQDAYIYSVVNVPIETEAVSPYKLGAPGHDLGTLTNDAPDAVVGKVGTLPERFPMRITARDLDTGRVIHRQLQIADELAAGLPTGTSSLSAVGPVALAQAAYTILRGSPSDQSGEMCVRIQLRERRKPLRFCNEYVGGSPGSAGGPLVSDLAEAATLIDSYKFGPLHITAVDVNLGLRRDLRQAFLLGAEGPDVVRRGRTYRFKVTARRVRGERFTRTIRVRVPRNAPAGDAELVLSGSSSDGGGEDLEDIFELVLGEEEGDGERGPANVASLARQVAALSRDDGVTAHFREAGADEEDDTGTRPIVVFEDADLRLSGALAVDVQVRR